jgi:hypothetical protein
MPVLRFPHIPTRFASGGRLTGAAWGSRPVNAPGAPTMSPALRPLPLLSPALRRVARGFPRDVFRSTTSRQKRQWDRTKGGAALPPHGSSQGYPRRDFDELSPIDSRFLYQS